MASRARQATMIAWRRRRLLHSVIRDITRGKSWKIKLFQEPMWRIAKGSFIDHIFMQSFRVLREGTSPGEILFITDLNTASLVERSLTAAISNISSASVMLECWQNLSKLTNQRLYQILVYRNDLLLSFPTGVLSLPLTALFLIFSCAVFCAAPWLIERLEEATFSFVGGVRCPEWAVWRGFGRYSCRNLTFWVSTRIQDMWREEANKPVDLVVLPHHRGIFQGYSVQVFTIIFFTLY